ncbi:FHA domain-containing protein [Clostridium sp. ZS2-4]|uniref:FHA domain-containing protein n=1 Tax=Clostridium sp. ZS2-4 TaxID=2987703 RepID=UPI00227CFCD4|nr:FHA domain-containing protein [Clostridium sp. ZS2-4]MCY6355728.1 FHA domain-containing protein [Clostridium sp. ZS2-4]
MKYTNSNNRNQNNKLLASLQIINLCICIILTLICILIYFTVKATWIKYILVLTVIIIGMICFVKSFQQINKKDLSNANIINTIALVNEDNQIIKEWSVSEKISMLIGKSTVDNEVDIDLSGSIYSTLIEEQHAVLNYAGGTWYIEDLCSNNGVSIQKTEDGMQYKLVKYSPCSITKGDILFIAKTKLLLI